MSSIRQKFVGFIRQFSTPSDTCREESRRDINCFIERYLRGNNGYKDETDVVHGRTPHELPPRIIGSLSQPVTASLTGPGDGLTAVNKRQKHLSISDPDVNFIDGTDEETGIDGDKPAAKNTVPMTKRELLPLQKSESVPNTRQNLHRQASQKSTGSDSSNGYVDSEIAGVTNWNNPNLYAFGNSVTLYEQNPLTNARAGDPIADCFAVVARKNSAILVLADGVNWGQKACIAARAAVHGCVDYVNKALFTLPSHGIVSTTDVFRTLLRSFHCAHNLIIQEQGMLTTLTAVVVLPLASSPSTATTTASKKYIACSCNVGDSLAYVYNSRTGVREITRGSHDVHTMRDMRDALGALGPVDGQNPELSNLTLAMTEVEPGDLVFVTSDGVSDNLDPVIGKFAGLPAVEAHQRHRLTLLRLEDLLQNGVTGKGSPVKNAKDLVDTLLDFVTRLTAAKRHILEDMDLYMNKDGKKLNQLEHRIRRKDMCGKLAMVPGKLDHATVAAYLVN